MIQQKKRSIMIAAGASVIAAPFIQIGSARAAEFTLKYAGNVNSDHPLTKGFVTAGKRIAEATSGRVQLNVFPNSQLGSEMEMLTQVRAGAIDLYTISGLVLSAMVPVASINGIGFAFPDYPDVWRAMDGPLGQFIRTSIEKTGLVCLEKIWNGGYRDITTSNKPINTPADLVGFRIRVPVSALWTSMFQAFKAAPVSINWGEVYSALQTKVVDGQETPLISIDASKLYEVQKYVSETKHMWDGFWCLANRRSMEKLPAPVRDIVVRIINETALEQRQEVIRLNNSLRTALTAKGLKFNQPDLKPFQETLQAAGFYRDWKAKYGDEAWALLETSIGRKLS